MHIWLWNVTLVSVEVTADIVIGNSWKECFSYVPKPNTQPEKCAKWVQAYSRKDFRVQDVKKDYTSALCILYDLGQK